MVQAPFQASELPCHEDLLAGEVLREEWVHSGLLAWMPACLRFPRTTSMLGFAESLLFLKRGSGADKYDKQCHIRQHLRNDTSFLSNIDNARLVDCQAAFKFKAGWKAKRLDAQAKLAEHLGCVSKVGIAQTVWKT